MKGPFTGSLKAIEPWYWMVFFRPNVRSVPPKETPDRDLDAALRTSRAYL